MAGLHCKVQIPNSNLMSNSPQSFIYSNQKTTFKLFTSNIHVGKSVKKFSLKENQHFYFWQNQRQQRKKKKVYCSHLALLHCRVTQTLLQTNQLLCNLDPNLDAKNRRELLGECPGSVSHNPVLFHQVKYDYKTFKHASTNQNCVCFVPVEYFYKWVGFKLPLSLQLHSLYKVFLPKMKSYWQQNNRSEADVQLVCTW